MILFLIFRNCHLVSCPHTRGDDPCASAVKIPKTALVPTRVGMIPAAIGTAAIGTACPHTRGDDPEYNRMVNMESDLSPHAWG